MKKLICSLFLLLLLAAAILPSAAAGGHVVDGGGFFTAEERSSLEQTYSGASGDVAYYLLTRDNLSAALSNTDVRAALSLTSDNDAIVLLIRRSEGFWYYDMYVFGAVYGKLTDKDIDTVLDAPEVYNNLKGGQLAKGAAAFTAQCQKALRTRASGRRVKTVVYALLVGTLAGGGAALVVFLTYRRKRHGVSYPLDRYARLNLTERHDIFVGSYVTRVRIRTENSGRSGGSLGGGSLGGGSFSGGHRGRCIFFRYGGKRKRKSGNKSIRRR